MSIKDYEEYIQKIGDNFDEYFIPKKDVTLTKELLERINKGIGYTKPANYYLFKKN